MHTHPASAPTSFRRQLCSRISEFDALVHALTTWGVAAGVPRNVMGSVVLILDELFANIVMHGYHNDPDGRVAVEARIADGAIHVTVVDHAPAFDPTQASEPDIGLSIEDRPIGGLGLMFVRRTADSFAWRRLDAGAPGAANEIRFTKRFAPA